MILNNNETHNKLHQYKPILDQNVVYLSITEHHYLITKSKRTE